MISASTRAAAASLSMAAAWKTTAFAPSRAVSSAVARRASPFGLQIHYHNRRRLPAKVEEELHATYWESLDQMLARMDIISINCPHTPATFHLLSARRLKLLRPQAYVVNTARGHAVERLTEHARSMGANAVVGVRFESSEVGDGLAETPAAQAAAPVPPPRSASERTEPASNVPDAASARSAARTAPNVAGIR